MNTTAITINPVQTVLERLQGVRTCGPDKWEAYCPLHEDPPDGHKRSLSVKRGSDGRALVYCHGCGRENTQVIVMAIGLTMADLMPPKANTAHSKPARRIVATYNYTDKTGDLLFQVLRYDPKDFRQRRPDDAGGWAWNLDGTPRVLYRLPELVAAEPAAWAFLSEGEKDADNLAALGLVATTNPGGAGKWRDEYSEALRGRRVAILYDKDADARGYNHACQVAASLHGIAADVRIVDLPGDEKDVSDWIEAHDAHIAEELTQRLTHLADSAPRFDPKPHAEGPVVVRLSDVEPEELTWLWEGKIPLGKLTMLAGNPGAGKSLLTLDLAARVSRGWPMPGADGGPCPVGQVVLLPAEDDLATVVRPRLDAVGADANRIVALATVRRIDRESGKVVDLPVSLDRDIAALEQAVAETGNVRLVVIDPIMAFLGRVDSHKQAEVCVLLTRLSDLAAAHNAAVLVVSHLNKNEGASAIFRTMGSLGFVASARSVLAVTKDKERPDRRFLLPVKSNYAQDSTGLAFAVKESPSAPGVAVVAWEAEPVSVSVEIALAPENAADAEGDRAAREEAKEWLQEVLADGPVAAKDLQRMAKDDGHAWRTVRRAKRDLKVVSRRDGFGPGSVCFWALPEHRGPENP